MTEEFQLGSKYELYASNKGMILLTSEIRMNILKELVGTRLTLADLSRNLGVSQSTLATNLAKMTEDGVIATEPDQIDNRKVFYILSSTPVIKSSELDKEAVQSSMDRIKDATVNPDNFFRDLLLSLSLKAMGFGIDLSPAFEKNGFDFGTELYNVIKADTVEDLIINVKKYFVDANIGDLNVYTFVPLTLTFQNTMAVSDAAHKLISCFLFGLFKALLKCHTGRRYQVTKNEVFGNGIIKFTVDVAPKK